MDKPLILIIEDEKPIRNFLCISLEAQNYKCIIAENGKTAISIALSYNPDIIIVDLGLPDIDGIEVIKKIRPLLKSTIIVVSARGHEREKVEALDIGADDYLTKPFSVPELLARIRVSLRRLNNEFQLEMNLQKVFLIGDFKVDIEKRCIYLSNKEIHFTPLEYKIIVLMVKNAGKVLTHKFILKEIWGKFSNNDNQSLRVFMANIRRKIENDPTQPRYIFTEVGVGYRFVDE